MPIWQNLAEMATATTSDVIHAKELMRVERIGTHSHIHGLGLDESLRAADIADGETNGCFALPFFWM